MEIESECATRTVAAVATTYALSEGALERHITDHDRASGIEVIDRAPSRGAVTSDGAHVEISCLGSIESTAPQEGDSAPATLRSHEVAA